MANRMRAQMKWNGALCRWKYVFTCERRIYIIIVHISKKYRAFAQEKGNSVREKAF